MTSGLFFTARSGPSPAPPGGPAGRYLVNPGGYTGHLARLLLAALAALRPGRRAAPGGRGDRRDRGPGLAAPAAARRLRRGRPAGHGPGPAAGRPGRGGGAVGPPDRAAPPRLGTLVARPAAPGLGVRLGRRHRRRDEHPPVGARHHPARPDRARRRGRLARRAHRHRPGRAAAAARGRRSAGGTLRLARPDILPLSTSHDPEAPLRALAGAAAGLAGGEHAVLQVLARPVTGARLRKARRAARKQRSGQSARIDLPAAGPGQPRARHQPEPGRRPRRSRAGRRDPRDHRQARRAAVGNPDPLRGRHHRPCPGPRRRVPVGEAGRRRAASGPAPRPGPRPRLGCRPAHRAELARPPPPSPPRRDRLPAAGQGRPAVGAGTGGDRPAARRPVAARPGPRRGTRRPPAARHPAPRPRRPPAGSF